MGYWNNLKKSFIIFQKNPILILPLLAGLIANTIVVGLFILFGDLLLTLSTGLSIEEAVYSLNSQIIIGILFVIAVVALWFVNNYFSAGFYGMAHDSLKKKTKLKNFFIYAKKYYYHLLIYTIIKNLLIFIFSIPLLIGIYLAFISPGYLSAILGLLGIILFVLMGLLIYIWLLFTPQLIVAKNIEGIKSFKRSWKLFMKHKMHFIKTFLIIFLLNILVMGLSLLITWPLEFYQLTAWSQSIGMLFNIIQVLLNIVIAIYLFLSLKL